MGITTCRREPSGIIASTNGVLMSMRRPDVRSIRSTRSASSPCPRIVVVSSLRPRRAMNTRPGSLTQNYFRLLDCLRLLLDAATDQVFSAFAGAGRPRLLLGVLRTGCGPRSVRNDRRSQSGPFLPPMSVPAALDLVAGRALRVPTGSAFDRPFPRPAAAGQRRVVGSGRESGQRRRATDLSAHRSLRVALKAASGTPVRRRSMSPSVRRNWNNRSPLVTR
jgi:hypothetical protein